MAKRAFRRFKLYPQNLAGRYPQRLGQLDELVRSRPRPIKVIVHRLPVDSAPLGKLSDTPVFFLYEQ